MSSIRPLATITILAAMGIFLYLKINEGPSSAPAQMPTEWEEAPKFEFGSPSTTGTPAPSGSAPAFAPPTAEPTTESAAPAPKFESTATAPSFESAPPTNSPSEATTTTSTAPPLPDLPPASNAPIESASQSDAASDVTSVAEPPTTATTDAAPPATAPPATAATEAPSTEAVPGLPPIPELPPLPSATSAIEAPGLTAPAPSEYGNRTTSAAMTPTASPFATARPAIDAALSQGELARAHLLLSDWYNDPALSPTEKEEVQTLLNQLAGTVIYSNEHRLEPAYTVQAGETLETIAEKHRVPWQLLAKINGIPSATGVQPGQTVKVIRGPFMGVVDVSDSELTLTIDGRYAGKFPVQLDGAATGEGEWTVEQKQLEPAAGPTATDRRLVLRNDEQTSATVLITTGSAPSAGSPPPMGTIRIATEHSEDLYDILSVGSRVVIRR